MAGGEGFEPSQSEPESDVLPLDDPPTFTEYSKKLNRAPDLSQDTKPIAFTRHQKNRLRGQPIPSVGNNDFLKIIRRSNEERLTLHNF